MATLFFDEILLGGGWEHNVRLSIDGGVIGAIARGVRAGPDDERHAIGLPGMPNVHSHAFQRGMAGLAEVRGPSSDTFWTWRETMYRFALTMTPEDVEAVAAQAYVEMLEAGFTRVGEFHYLHHDPDGVPYAEPAELAGRIAAAAEASGIGLTLLPCFYAHAGFGGVEPHAGQRRFVTGVDQFAALVEASRAHIARLDGARLGIAPHSLRAVTPEELEAVVPLAAGGPVHIHAAEQVREVEDCLAWSGRRPVQWLLDNAGPDRHWCFIHATHMTPVEAQRLADSGIVAGLCPITEANLGDGIFPARDFAGGGAIAIGTDSNVLVDVAGELRQLEYAQRLAHRERNVLALHAGQSMGRVLLEAALAGGAQALGFPAAGIAEGAPADLVSLDPDHAALVERTGDRLIDGWIFAARCSPVDCVWVRGRKLVEGGRHLRREPTLQRFRTSIRRLLA